MNKKCLICGDERNLADNMYLDSDYKGKKINFVLAGLDEKEELVTLCRAHWGVMLGKMNDFYRKQMKEGKIK